MQVVVEINNEQYLMTQGEIVPVRVALDSTAESLQVRLLAVLDGEKSEFGKPELTKKVNLEVGEMVKGDKVTTHTFKAKSRYRKTYGMRPKFINVKFLGLK